VKPLPFHGLSRVLVHKRDRHAFLRSFSWAVAAYSLVREYLARPDTADTRLARALIGIVLLARRCADCVRGARQ
jgi:hypothetical protein